MYRRDNSELKAIKEREREREGWGVVCREVHGGQHRSSRYMYNYEQDDTARYKCVKY